MELGHASTELIFRILESLYRLEPNAVEAFRKMIEVHPELNIEKTEDPATMPLSEFTE